MTAASSLLLWEQPHSFGAQQDLQTAVDLLSGTRNATTPPLLRIYRPEPTVVFGQRDTRLPGYQEARRRAEELGYTRLVRRAGGRAAAYHPGALVVDHIEPDPDPIKESQLRFTRLGGLLEQALAHAGVPVRMGPIPGEYCYGEHSVHGINPQAADTRIKLVGTAQRQISSGWLFSSVILAEGGAQVRRVLTPIYEALGIGWDPLTAGAASDLCPEVTVGTVQEAVINVYRQHWDLTAGQPDLPE